MAELNLYRRHLKKCQFAERGRSHTKCPCPIWADGELNGKRYRRSLGTRDWQRAIRKLAAIEDPRAPRLKPVSEAITAFEQHCRDLAAATQAKYRITLCHLRAYCDRVGIADLSEITLEHLDAFRASRALGSLSALKELQRLRYFFGFCVERNWMAENVAKKTKVPRNIKPPEVVPYEPAEIARMIAACDVLGRAPYERLRAKALILLLRYTGLRITDAITLGRDRVRAGQLLLHTQKTGGTVFLPIPTELQAALDSLPIPRGTHGRPAHFFWNGTMSKRAIKGVASRTLATVFNLSGVPGAHAHRFRHTLATEILVKGGTEQDVADILGISPAIVRKHYAKWTQARQQRITDLMRSVDPGTYLVHGENALRTN